jgi:hypothetical protein
VEVYSTLGDKLVNSAGVGLVYATVKQNNKELDPMLTLSYGTEEQLPTAPKKGDYFYVLYPSTQEAVLKRYSGSEWIETNKLNGGNTGQYVWTLYDQTGNVIRDNVLGKALYIDGNVVNKKTIFSVEVII